MLMSTYRTCSRNTHNYSLRFCNKNIFTTTKPYSIIFKAPSVVNFMHSHLTQIFVTKQFYQKIPIMLYTILSFIKFRFRPMMDNYFIPFSNFSLIILFKAYNIQLRTNKTVDSSFSYGYTLTYFNSLTDFKFVLMRKSCYPVLTTQQNTVRRS